MSEKRREPEIEEAEEAVRSIEATQEEDFSGQATGPIRAEGRLDDMGASFAVLHGSAYVLSNEQNPEILYVLKGDNSQFYELKGQSVRVQGKQVQERAENKPATLEVTSITPL